MTIDIFIKTYPGDYKWLKFCMLSVDMFASGYDKIIIVNPATATEEERIRFNTIIPDNMFDKAAFVWIVEEGDGYKFQMVCKLRAHINSTADYIMFADSDTFFNRPVDLRTLLTDGKPTILHTPYSQLPGVPWQEPTEKVFNREVEFEFMRRHGMICHRSTLINFEKWFEDTHKCSLLDYFKTVDTISEFNLIFAYAYFYEHDKYNWINTSTHSFPPCVVDQIWSWADKDGDEVHQKEYARALETINRIFNLNLTEL